MLDKRDIVDAYRYFLNRGPENDSVIDNHIASSTNFVELRQKFLSSNEFYKVNGLFILRYLAKQQGRGNIASVEHETSPENLKRLFKHIQHVWSRLGEIEPHFSVLSSKNYKPENIEKNMRDFLKSGESEVSIVLDELKSHGLTTNQFKHVVELGCGVGRVTRYLADISDKVTGFDVSGSHLKVAQEYIEREGKRNVVLKRIERFDQYKPGSCDLFYSRIVLQHNPPPIMYLFLAKSLQALSPGGIAVFQLPTSISGYKFDVEDYLRKMDGFDNQELHALPQQIVFKAAKEAECDVITVYRDSSISLVSHVSNRFILKKRE